MQENEFEKRVREEMGELRLRPSGMVWEKVEAQLKKRKKKRVVFFIFLLAGLSLLGSGGYFIYTNEKQNLTEQNITTVADERNDNTIDKDDENKTIDKDDHIRTEKIDNLFKKPVNKGQQSTAKDQLVDDEQINSADRNNQGANDITKTDEEEKPDSDKVGVVKEKRNKLQVLQPLKKKKSVTVEDLDDNKQILTQRNKDDKQQKKDDTVNEKPATDKDAVDDKPTDTKKIKTETALTGQKQNEVAKADSAVAFAEIKEREKPVEQKKKKSSSNIKWGIDVSAGFSKIGSNAFSFSDNSSKAMADAVYNSPGNVSGGQARIITPPSEVKQGFAFKAGVVAEKNISKKSSLSAGLSYAHYSNTIKAGIHKDTSFVLRNMALQTVSLNEYYRGPQKSEYTNRYHFIQLPVYYQLQLNKGVKTPLLWNIGISAGYLLNTNALVYDTAAGGIYYRDKDAFSKMHFNINTGFAFRFGNKKLQYSIGPELSMDMRRLMKDATQPKQYFLYSGLTGRILFTKKK